MNVHPDSGAPTPTQLYRVYDTVEKEPALDYRSYAENFEHVAAGEVFAESTDETHAHEASKSSDRCWCRRDFIYHCLDTSLKLPAR
jgi:hypothetical protein